MGLFDFFKSPEEKLKEEMYKAIFEEAFPGGSNQLENELVELCKILDYKYPIDEIRRAYMVSTQSYFLTRNKTKEKIMLSILLTEKNKIQKDDAIKISDFLTRKLGNYAKVKSLLFLASQLNCDPIDVKKTYLDSLKTDELTINGLKKLINIYQSQKEGNSVSLNMAIENTPAALFELWTQEYLESLEEEKLLIDPVKEFLFKEIFKGQPQPFDSMMKYFAYEEEPAEFFRLEAIDKIYDDKNYKAALEIIDKGLSINDKSTEPYLYNLRAECNILIGDYVQALKDINEALLSFKINSPDDDRALEDSLKIRMKIKNFLEDNYKEYIIEAISVEPIRNEEGVNYVTAIKGKLQAKEILIQLIEVRYQMKLGTWGKDEEMTNEERIEYFRWLDKQDAVFMREFNKIANEDEIKLKEQIFPKKSLEEILNK